MNFRKIDRLRQLSREKLKLKVKNYTNPRWPKYVDYEYF